MTTTVNILPSRPKYDGPRTQWTRPDGEYSVTFTVPMYWIANTTERPACLVANERVAQALGRDLANSGINSTVGHIGNLGSPDAYSAIFVSFYVQAESDAKAVEQVVRASMAVGAVGVQVLYMQPNEYGASGDSREAVVSIPAPTKMENLPEELRLV